jgi:hypothetical protein
MSCEGNMPTPKMICIGFAFCVCLALYAAGTVLAIDWLPKKWSLEVRASIATAITLMGIVAFMVVALKLDALL